jgi:hypothetical protein
MSKILQKPIGQTQVVGITSCMHDLVVNKTKTLVEVASFISLSYDEVTTSNQQSWVSIHAYVVENCQRIPLLLFLQ